MRVPRYVRASANGVGVDRTSCSVNELEARSTKYLIRRNSSTKVRILFVLLDITPYWIDGFVII
jgi:hypothetical protein